MGLDITHECWHGSYSSFNSFRYDLGRQIGINLDHYAGYGGVGVKNLESIEHDLMPLFNHSDCDGYLQPIQCGKIANALDGILSNLNHELEIETLNFENKIKQFRNGCRDAAKLNEIVEFN